MDIELLRKRVRDVLGYRSPAYRLGASLLTQYQTFRREGWNTMRDLQAVEGAGVSEIALSLRSLHHSFVIRPGTDDLSTLVNNAIREEYGQFANSFAPEVIVDVGAYIGDTSAYFLSRFPMARVVALEPNEDSFLLASRNLLPYGERVSLLKTALWTEVTTVRFGGVQTGATIRTHGNEIPTVTIPSLMSKFNLKFIDLLKLDIEGAESQIVPAGVGGWLNKVGTLCLETHGNEIEKLLIPILTGTGFSCRRFRNVWYCNRER